jgi:hypothetical protein
MDRLMRARVLLAEAAAPGVDCRGSDRRVVWVSGKRQHRSEPSPNTWRP